MSLNKQKGNMYSFFNQPPYTGWTWNPIKGLCPYDCSYCFASKMYQQYKWKTEFRLDEKCFKDNLAKNKYIFIGSSTDMWSHLVSDEWINSVLDYIKKFPDNQYFFQSKNPGRFHDFILPVGSIICTTIETNRTEYYKSFAPSMKERSIQMGSIDLKKMITIEPIMNFDLKNFLHLVKSTNPVQINIGADSGHNNLPEPPKEKLLEFITELKKTDIKIVLKDNLKRLTGGDV